MMKSGPLVSKHAQASLSGLLDGRQGFQALRDRLNDLFDEDDLRKRGTALEGVLNDLFETEGILIRNPLRSVARRGIPLNRSTTPSKSTDPHTSWRSSGGVSLSRSTR